MKIKIKIDEKFIKNLLKKYKKYYKDYKNIPIKK
jgi:hypothetical protein